MKTHLEEFPIEFFDLHVKRLHAPLPDGKRFYIYRIMCDLPEQFFINLINIMNAEKVHPTCEYFEEWGAIERTKIIRERKDEIRKEEKRRVNKTSLGKHLTANGWTDVLDWLESEKRKMNFNKG